VNKIVIIDNHSELEIIEKQYPDLKNESLILLSANFSLTVLDKYKKRGYTFYDEVITDEDANLLNKQIYHLLWNWFLDEDGHDLSLIDGCSLGVAFCGSIELFIATLFRYQCGLEKLLNRSHEVFFTYNTEDIFLDVIYHLQRKIGFAAHPVKTNQTKEIVTYGKHNLILDVAGRKRDLTPLFLSNKSWKGRIGKNVLHYLYVKRGGEKRVLLMLAGKMEAYLEYINKNVKSPEGFCWILPLSNSSNPLSRRTLSQISYYFSSGGPRHTLPMDTLISRLKKNILDRITSIEGELLIKVMNRHTFVYFQGALNYFHNAEKTLRKLKPKIVVISTEAENNFLVTQAANKLNIKTALLPHGIDVWGFKEIKCGRFQTVDYCFAHGNEDITYFENQGVSAKAIRKTSHPWYEKLLPVRPIHEKKYNQALVLAYEMYSNSAYEKISVFNKYIVGVVETLLELGIVVKYFKIRGEYVLKSHGEASDDNIKVGEHSIKVVQGYGNLVDYLDQVDLVVGPISTALIESGLCGKDYYAYQSHRHLELVDSGQPSIYKYVNVAFDMKQLRENIINKQTYEPNCSVSDLVDLDGIKTKEGLFQSFESEILAVLDDIATSKNEPTTEGTIGR
jgi:hypothetical protein